MIPCNAACTKPPREAMLCVTVGAAQLRRVVCIECRVALDRQGREVNVHHGASVASWCEARPVPTLTERPAPPECQEREALVSQQGTPPAPSHSSPQVATMPNVSWPVCLFPGCESHAIKSRGLCGRDLSRARTLGMLEVEDIDYPALGPAWAAREAERGRGSAEVARLTAALEASNARNLVTIESVGRLERERDEVRADLAAIDDALGLPGGRETSSADRLWRIEGCRTFHDDELEAIDGALGFDEFEARHDGDRVERIEALHERLLVAEQDRDRLAGRLADAKSLDESAVHDLGRGTLDAPVIKATRIALDGLGEVCTDPCARALLDVVRALVCG